MRETKHSESVSQRTIEERNKVLEDLRKAVGLADGNFDEELFLELEKRIYERDLFAIKVNNVLGVKPRMEVVKCTGKSTGNTFDLREYHNSKKNG